jgi:hypothetical protein
MKSLITFVFLFALIAPAHSQASDAEGPKRIIQANLDAYNKGDIEAFMSYFSEDILIRNFDSGETTALGKKEVRNIYSQLFEASPNLHSRILKRTVFDNKVIDHEHITGRNGKKDPLELVLIYEVRSGKIFRISVIRHAI